MTQTDTETSLNVVPMAILRLDRVERVVFANDAALSLFGDDVTGRPITSVLRHPDFLQALALVNESGQKIKVPLTATVKSGQASLEAHIIPVDPDILARTGAGVLVAFEDQTALRQAAAIRRDFVANVSHELRTPLTALVGFIETLKGAARDDLPTRDRFLTIMESEANRMIRLVNDLLSLSRVEADEHSRPSQTVDLLALLGAVLATHREQAKAANVKIELKSTEQTINVRGDADQLMQVFHNLTENGIKYGGAGGVLRISVCRVAREPRLRGPAVIIEVSDDGEGIDPIHLPRLTERFYRVDSHRSREQGGTGLGLAIVKHIVNRHRGRFKIESEAKKGSNFIVILPDF
jgi:two-component system, OmpR family, phosphate regulon sensor histidine kinase PhoR